MYELPDRYVFETLLDGKAFFHKKSYREHAKRHLIDAQQYREDIQETLIDPHVITKHDKIISGRVFRHHTYYRLEQNLEIVEMATYLYHWKVVVRMVGGSWRWCVVTAFLDARPLSDIINRRGSRLIYKKELI